jgi:phage gp29-like protein
MQIELLEASRAGNVTYESLCDYMDRQISKRVLGQTLTTEVKGDGSYAASQTHNEVRGEILEADADLLDERLNETLIRWIVDYNFAGVTQYPKLSTRTKEKETQKDLAERDKLVLKDIGGIQVPKRYFYETYGYPEPEEGEDVWTGDLKSEISNLRPSGGEFVEAKDDPIAGITDSLERETEKFTDGLVQPVRDLVDHAETLEELRDGIMKLYADLDVSDLGAIMQRAFAAAELAGRYEVKGEG